MNTIEAKVREEVFSLFAEGEFVKAEKLLRLISFELTELNTTEEHRLVIRNLAYAYYVNGNIPMAKKHSKLIKEIVDKDKEYQKENLDGYFNVLNIYSEMFKDDLTKEELLQISRTNFEFYANKPEFLDCAIMNQANICILEERYFDIEDILIDIHIYEEQEKGTEMGSKLQATEKEILKDLKLDCPYIYNDIMKNMYTLNLSNTITAM